MGRASLGFWRSAWILWDQGYSAWIDQKANVSAAETPRMIQPGGWGTKRIVDTSAPIDKQKDNWTGTGWWGLSAESEGYSDAAPFEPWPYDPGPFTGPVGDEIRDTRGKVIGWEW